MTKRFAIALATIGATAMAAGAAAAQDRPAIMARAEQCLIHNVDRIVAVEPDINSAARFLVDFTCAGEVAGAERYERNVGIVKMVGTMFKTVGQIAAAGKSPSAVPEFDATVDPETGEIVSSKASSPGAAGPAQMVTAPLSQLSVFMPEASPVSIRKLAGDLVLAARERQVSKGR